MIDREKVLKGFEHCQNSGCNGCPYYTEGDGCECKLDLDAMELLKEQDAKILTLQDLDTIYNTRADHVWPYNTPPYLWMIVNPNVRWTRGFWVSWGDVVDSLKNLSPFYVCENYGKSWKLWTRKPADKQLKEVKWE